jgi:phosphomevalonate kinase
MGDLAGVPIEPKEQTALLDRCIAIPGVICGGVPGAGGYDAIWLLVADMHSRDSNSGVVKRVEDLWESWKDMDVSPLGAGESTTGGARVEHAETVPGLIEALASG